MKGKKSALILDMDGVIVDSEPIHKKADILTLRSIGLEVPLAVLQEYAGTGAERFFTSILKRFSVKGDVHALRETKNEILSALLQEDTPPVPGIFDLLDRTETPAWKRAVASSSEDAVVDLVLRRLNLETRFHTVVGGSGFAKGKPAPHIFLEASARLEVLPDRCVVVEDSTAGVRAAKAAGMPCIGFRNPLSGAQDLSLSDRIVDSLDAIGPGLLQELLHP
ncbi:MAG: HAD family hydrolase [Planctomycetota bacterium]|jgi:HAD superfamily hydrolase (TIGR01509 family)